MKRAPGLRWTTLYAFDNLPEKHYPSLELLDPELPLGEAYLLKEQLLLLLFERRGRPFPGRTFWRSVRAKTATLRGSTGRRGSARRSSASRN